MTNIRIGLLTIGIVLAAWAIGAGAGMIKGGASGSSSAGDIESVTAGAGLIGGGTSGAVTLSVDAGSITSGVLLVANGGTGLASGTSGGVLAYTASGTLASSTALTANQLVKGGGAGVAPSTLAAGTQNHVLTMGASDPAWALPVAGSSFLNATSSLKSIGASGQYSAMTTNSVALTAGTWLVWGYCIFTNGGSDPNYTGLGCGIMGANGADSGVLPTQLSATSNLTMKSVLPTQGILYLEAALTNFGYLPSTQAVVAVSATVSVYIVPYNDSTAATNGRVTTYISAMKISNATN